MPATMKEAGKKDEADVGKSMKYRSNSSSVFDCDSDEPLKTHIRNNRENVGRVRNVGKMGRNGEPQPRFAFQLSYCRGCLDEVNIV